jgi:hypothetical protein
VPAAGQADAVGGGEGRHQVIFKLAGRDSGEPARACAPGQFLVHLAVIPGRVIRREDQGKMVENILVGEFREAAGALGCRHVGAFP